MLSGRFVPGRVTISSMSVAFTVAAVVAAASCLFLRRTPVTAPAFTVAVAVSLWNLIGAVRGPGDLSAGPVATTVLVVAEIGAAALFLGSLRLAHARWLLPVWVRVLAVVAPFTVIALTLPAVGLTSHEEYVDGPGFVVHLLYCITAAIGAAAVLNIRRRDPSRHVRLVVRGLQATIVAVLTVAIAHPTWTSLVAVPLALLLVAATRWPQEWSRASSRIDELVDSLGIFIFVIDRDDTLSDCNGPADGLVREITGEPPRVGECLATLIGVPPPYLDGADVELHIRGWIVRTVATVSPVDPLGRRGDRVLMLRPVDSRGTPPDLPRIARGLEGHDPATQTLDRKAAKDHVRGARRREEQVLRVEVTADAGARSDEIMFLAARRLESLEPSLRWARLAEWTLVAVGDVHPGRLPTLDDVGARLTASTFTPLSHESEQDFVTRVDHPDRGTTLTKP